jgi:hypothetical protein
MSEIDAPETITIPEAVKRLAEWFGNNFYIRAFDWGGGYDVEMSISVDFGKNSDWLDAIKNGNNTLAAIRVGLEDLFTSILEGDEV